MVGTRPRDLVIVHKSCRGSVNPENAYYEQDSGQVVVCYELLDQISRLAWANSETDKRRDGASAQVPRRLPGDAQVLGGAARALAQGLDA